LKVAAEVTARRTKSTERSPEVYGAETLPILIRLPDLTLASRAATRLSASAMPEEVTATVTDPVVAAPDPSPPRRERERYATTGAVRQDRQAYGGGRVRRGIREDQSVGWRHGVRQFLVAVVMAGILLAVIVTIKEWNQAPSKATSVAPREHVDVSPMDFGQPELAPAANATREPPSAPMDTVEASGRTLQGAVPAGMMSFDSGPSPHIENTGPIRVEDQPVAPDAAGYADGADSEPRGYGNYPTTGVAPVEVGPLPSGSAAGPAWPTSFDRSSPVRSADRSGASPHYSPQR
jgi:hypothetical protein